MKAASRPAAQVSDTVESAPEASQAIVPAIASTSASASEPEPAPKSAPTPTPAAAAEETIAEEQEEDEDEEMQSIDAKIAAARARLSPNNCLFCPQTFDAMPESLTHMASAHSFFIPDGEYLVDVAGLITYLGEKIAVGNVCIFCNEAGRAFRSLDAVRKHMLAKSHCKIAYDRERDRLELSDFYDFSTSYPDADQRPKKTKKAAVEDADDEEWEEASDVDDGEVDEVVDDSASDATTDSEDASDSDDSIPANEMSYGDSPFELVLPSGARIGHRTMKRYYAQSFPAVPRGSKPEDPNSGAALVRRLLKDKNSALVPVRGAFGAFGRGTEVIKARNRGEAREAGRHVREFRDMKRREDFKTKIGFIGNSQKHYRDPLLQVSRPESSSSTLTDHLLYFSDLLAQSVRRISSLLSPASSRSCCMLCIEYIHIITRSRYQKAENANIQLVVGGIGS